MREKRAILRAPIDETSFLAQFPENMRELVAMALQMTALQYYDKGWEHRESGKYDPGAYFYPLRGERG